MRVRVIRRRGIQTRVNDGSSPKTAEASEKGLLRRLRRELRAGADTTEKEACRAVGQLSHLLR